MIDNRLIILSMLLSVLLLSLIFLLIVNWSGPKRDKLTPSHAKKLANGPRRFAHSPRDIIVPILGTAKFSSRIFLISKNREKIRENETYLQCAQN